MAANKPITDDEREFIRAMLPQVHDLASEDDRDLGALSVARTGDLGIFRHRLARELVWAHRGTDELRF